ncbi:GlxA family transcriptional regulator [Patulibacter defluvii]|uniref:GlxA family transcriptional regulator n=1 Tax=Patulibacter defluvii TaxID=3095358 RepID=UPI002A751F08|nr:helix-turn-helix domain-containing protein [Patulibacter sp. DM4]
MVHRVAVLALDRVVPFDLGIPARVFGAARDGDGRPLYAVATCAIGGGSVRTSADFSIAVDHDERLLRRADTVVVATQEPEGALAEDGVLPEPVLAALRAIPERTRVVSICTGSFVLAAAGLLDGRPAATHWMQAERFRRLFPRVTLDPDVLFVDDGRVLTAAGGAAGVDLCLHLIRRDHGAMVANAAARRCVVSPWREGGQAQFVEPPPPRHGDATTAPTREWALGRLRDPLTLAEMAAHARMSVRTFSRRFRAEVGVSPARWIIQRRVDLARSLLETTDLPVETVAHEAGFGSAAGLRQHLQATIGVAPLAYRRTFRGEPAAPAA